MRIALYGYGKMGKAIEQVAIARGHSIVLKVDASNAGTSPVGNDVAIEFSKPDEAMANIRLCLEAKVPVIVGTTGWYDHLSAVRSMVQSAEGTLLWASNFSIGVNLFFKLNKYLAGMMDTQADYDVHIDEVHHIHKLDAPSGTAQTLAFDIGRQTQRYLPAWHRADPKPEDFPNDLTHEFLTTGSIPIGSEREGEVPGKHSVTWASAEDKITITHDAFGRQGFATGAVVAAEWVQGRTGLFTMDDVLSLPS